jgi:hypothetical protein
MPRLASWNRTSDPAQQRLQAYLDEVQAKLAPVLATGRDWGLTLVIDVESPARLLHHYDLENYVTPLIDRLGPDRFVYVAATKQVGGGSYLAIGPAQPGAPPPAWTGWSGRVAQHLTGKPGKTAIRAALQATVPQPLPSGPVAVQLAFRAAAARNWVTFWKPVGDAMGPVLGEPYPARPFYPNDDRITHLVLHRLREHTLDSAVDVGLWWQGGGAWAG